MPEGSGVLISDRTSTVIGPKGFPGGATKAVMSWKRPVSGKKTTPGMPGSAAQCREVGTAIGEERDKGGPDRLPG